MSAPSRLNKENFRLLDLSSDEESEDLQLDIIPSRKKKMTRRERRGNPSQSQEPNIGAEVQCALRWAVRGTLILWLIMLTWICAALYDQVSTMRMEIAKVSTSSDGVGDALQICHTAAKELRANASSLNIRLAKLELDHQELVKKVQQAVKGLTIISDQLSEAPKLADTPKRIAELQMTVATFGSQINGFDGALNSAKKQAQTATAGVEELRTLLHQLDARTNETIANVTANAKLEEDIKSTLLNLNTTLVSQVEALNTRIQEFNKPVSAAPLAPVPTVPSTAAIALLNTNATTTSTLPPAPAKPSVLQ